MSFGQIKSKTNQKRILVRFTDVAGAEEERRTCRSRRFQNPRKYKALGNP